MSHELFVCAESSMSAPEVAFSAKLHFHIQWSGTTVLDWKAFKTREEAEAAARGLVRKHETYTIEARLGECERCEEIAERVLRQVVGSQNELGKVSYRRAQPIRIRRR